jgi:hypothetical protein
LRSRGVEWESHSDTPQCVKIADEYDMSVDQSQPLLAHAAE